MRYDANDEAPYNHNWYSIVQATDGSYWQSPPFRDADLLLTEPAPSPSRHHLDKTEGGLSHLGPYLSQIGPLLCSPSSNTETQESTTPVAGNSSSTPYIERRGLIKKRGMRIYFGTEDDTKGDEMPLTSERFSGVTNRIGASDHRPVRVTLDLS